MAEAAFGRLCVVRLVDAYMGSVLQKPRKLESLQEVVPEGSAFVACGWKTPVRESPYGWVDWEVVMLCENERRQQDWMETERSVRKALGMGCSFRGDRASFEVVGKQEEAEVLTQWELDLEERSQGGEGAVWTGSFSRLLDSVRQREERYSGDARMRVVTLRD